MRPALSFKHFEHSNLFCIEGIAFDVLEMHGHETAALGFVK